MSLTSSLYSGISGLANLGNAMQVIGDNIANTNTTAFKGSRYVFQDLLSQTIATQSGSAQVGRGMAIGDVSALFQQGSFESTGNTTDLAIGGDGFFVLREAVSQNLSYSRAGNFRFDKEGVLINPEGYVVQGWALDEEGSDVGSVTDVRLESFTSPPDVSEHMTVITNLDSDALSQTSVLSNVWNSDEPSPIDSTNYHYQSVIKVYDSLGSTHDITVYYDKKTGSEWEYLVCCNPAEDNRNTVQGTPGMGLLARGSITFSDSSGNISDFTMERFTGLIGNVSTSGSLAQENTNIVVQNYDALNQDGYGFNFIFDGSAWDFQDTDGDGIITAVDKPLNYPNATIISSGANGIQLNLDGDPDNIVDVEIVFQSVAQAADELGFDVINPMNIHIQNVTNSVYTGETGNDNSTLEINNPEVLTYDVTGLRVNWDASEETWYWSMPELQNIENPDTTGLVPAVTVTETVSDASAMTSYSDSVTLTWDAALTEWTFTSPYARSLTGTTYGGGVTGLNTSTTIIDQTVLTGDSFGNELAWDNTLGTWGWSAGAAPDPVEYPAAAILATLSDADGVSIDLNGDGGADVTFSFLTSLAADGTVGFDIDTHIPPFEYQNAVIDSTLSDASAAYLDLNGDGLIDVDFAFSAPVTGGDFVFDIDPRIAPLEYPRAVITGDNESVQIDIDNDGEDDITFSFAAPLSTGPGAIDSAINFDIEGSTAWTAMETNSNGYFRFMADFLGGADGVTEMEVELDIGTRDDGTGQFVNDSMTTTQYARASTTVFQSADGYGAGDFQGVDVGTDGVMTGIYSNGQLIPLYRVALAKFLNIHGLYKDGGSLYRETRDSGDAITNRPGTNGLGSITPNSLEQSNVDIAAEFVKMITTQRGFQANSKVVTTVDAMLAEVINMKR